MKLRRVLRSLCAVAVAGVAMVGVQVVTPGAAHANVSSGSRIIYFAGGDSYAGWRDSDDYLNISVTPRTIAAGKCATLLFDWTRPAGHFDAEIVRSCVNGGFYSSGDTWNAGYGLTGMQKLGTCVGNSGAETSGSCVNQSDAVGSVTTISLATLCARQWSLLSPGTTQYKSGGVRDSCTS